MNKLYPFLFYSLFIFFASVSYVIAGGLQDTTKVIKLNKQGFDVRMTSPRQTVDCASKALEIARKNNYINGIGESYRIMGIGYYYSNQPVKAIDDYLTALNYFSKNHNLRSQSKVYNNIGTLYLDNDYDLSLEFFNKSLIIALKLADKEILAKLYLNIGSVYYRKQSFHEALKFYDKSNVLYAELNDSTILIQCLQNKGVIYYNLKDFTNAEVTLKEANRRAKEMHLNEPVSSIDLTLAMLYIAQNKFKMAESTVREGLIFSKIIKDDKLNSDFEYTKYQLELKRKNYKQAVIDLKEIYKTDSAVFKQNTSTQIKLISEQVKQDARQRQNAMLLQRQEYDRVKFWSVTLVAGLLLISVGLLISNVKRKANTNIQLTNLNAEVSRQKDNLDRINHHLEEIIDERTKDLQIKNKKLFDYSSYLSHQIRGPIATLKGLMNLEKEGLVDQPECIRMMNKCVGEIDNKIIETAEMLHEPAKDVI